MKNRIIRDRYAALTVLSQRVLPSTSATSKVTALLRRFEPAYQVTEKRRKDIISEHPVPEGWDKKDLPAFIAEARQTAVEEMLEESQRIAKLPDHLRLTESDMPHKLKRDDGENNIEGLAHIVSMLGSLYKPTGDEVKFATVEATEEEEPEEYAPAPVDPRATEPA